MAAFCGYFNDTRDDVTSEDLHSQWEKSLARFDDFDSMGMIKSTPPEVYLKIEKYLLTSKKEF